MPFPWVMAASPRGKQKKIAGDKAGSDNDSSQWIDPTPGERLVLKG
jgi:hypothetical protein